ncbi:MAG: YceI family protein [Terriglobales bacterium]
MLLLLAFVLAGFSAAMAQSIAVDVSNSRLIVRVFRSGLFSGFAHDHEISAPLSGGEFDPTAMRVQVRFDVRKMQVLDTEASVSDRAKIQATMLSEKVLDAQRFPEITFTSQRIVPGGNGAYTVEGELTLHGVSRRLTVPVSLSNGRYIGSVKLNQTAYGIKPVKLFGGTVKVKDQVQITFEVVPLRWSDGQQAASRRR